MGFTFLLVNFIPETSLVNKFPHYTSIATSSVKPSSFDIFVTVRLSAINEHFSLLNSLPLIATTMKIFYKTC